MTSYTVNVEGIPIKVPVAYEDVSALMLFFPANYTKIQNIIRSERITPVKIFGNTCLLGLTIFDYIKCEVGPYRELALSVPVMLDTKFTPPVLPLVFDSFFKNFGFFTNLLAMNTDIARAHSEDIFGYPTYNKKIKINPSSSENYMNVVVSDGPKQIMEITATKPKRYKKLGKKIYNTYFAQGNDLYKVEMAANALVANSFSNKNCLYKFSDHEICDKYINKLLLSDKPLQKVYYKQAVEVLSEPLKL